VPYILYLWYSLFDSMSDPSGTRGANGSTGLYDDSTADIYVDDKYFLPTMQLPVPKPEDPSEDFDEWQEVISEFDKEERSVSVTGTIRATAASEY
jgi:hypothetical protein